VSYESGKVEICGNLRELNLRESAGKKAVSSER